MSAVTPPANQPQGTPPGPLSPLLLSAAVAVVISVGLIVLLAIGKTSWSEVGPVITILAGVHSGAALVATPGK